MPLEVATGHATATGPRPHNEDFVGMVTPTGDELARKGIVLAIADGVSGHAGGREGVFECAMPLTVSVFGPLLPSPG